jgi:hypothetical protein
MRPLYVFGSCVLALTLCVGGGVAWNRVLWRMGWFQGPPALAKGMPPQVGSESRAWSYRLRQAFPLGSSESRMTARLKRDGFEVDAERRRAAYGWAAYPCVYTLTVTWRADGSRRVRDIQGGLHNACTDPDKLIPERGPRRRQTEGERREERLVPGRQSA